MSRQRRPERKLAGQPTAYHGEQLRRLRSSQPLSGRKRQERTKRTRAGNRRRRRARTRTGGGRKQKRQRKRARST